MNEEELIDPQVDVFLSQISETDILNDRFNHKTSEDEIKNIVKSSKPKNTMKQEIWAVKIWRDWATCKNMEQMTQYSDHLPLPILLHENMCFDKFIHWLPFFIMEVKNKDGNSYSPETLKQIIASLYRHLKDNCNYNGVSFLDKKSNVYKVLEAKMKSMKKQGLGLEVKRADIVTKEDEEQLWSAKVFDLETSKGLFNAVFFYTGKVLALRGREEHRALQIEQFNIVDSNGSVYLKFWPILRKNDHDKVLYQQMRKDPIIHYDDPDNCLSYVKIVKKYLDCLPEKQGPFYRRPLEASSGIAYSRQPVGINTLSNMLKNLFQQANIDITNRNISNHGLRATSATELLQCGFEIPTIRKRTGHRSNAIETYLRSDKRSDVATSKCLDPPKQKSSEEIDLPVNNESKSEFNDGDEAQQLEVKKKDNEIVIAISSGNKKIRISL